MKALVGTGNDSKMTPISRLDQVLCILKQVDSEVPDLRPEEISIPAVGGSETPWVLGNDVTASKSAFGSSAVTKSKRLSEGAERAECLLCSKQLESPHQ